MALRTRGAASQLQRLWKGGDTTSTSIRAFFVSILILGLNMLTGILTSRYLGPHGRGDNAAIILWPQFMAFALTFGIHSAVLYNIKKYPEDAGRLYTAALVMSCAAGAIACAVGYFFIPVWLADYSPQVITFAQLSMAASPVLLFSFINNAVLRAREEFWLFNLTRYLVPSLTLVALLMLVALGKLTPFTSAVSYLSANVPVMLWMTVRLLRIYRPKLKGLAESFKRNVKYGIGSMGIDLLGNLGLYIDQLIVIRLLASKELGLYVVAVSLSRMANIFSQSLSLILFPKASGMSKEEAVSMTLRAFRISTFISLLAAGAAMPVASYVLKLFYGPEFTSAVQVFRILIFEVILLGACMILSQAFMALNKPGVVTGMYAIGLLVTVPMMYLLIPIYGIKGAGLALLCAGFGRFIYIVLHYPLSLKVGFPKLISPVEDWNWLSGMLSDKMKTQKINRVKEV